MQITTKKMYDWNYTKTWKSKILKSMNKNLQKFEILDDKVILTLIEISHDCMHLYPPPTLFILPNTYASNLANLTVAGGAHTLGLFNARFGVGLKCKTTLIVLQNHWFYVIFM